jgi:hypothetical protein
VSLLSTPLSGKEVVLGKLVGSMKPLVGLVIFFLPAWVLAILWDSLSLFAVPPLLIAICVYGFAVASVGLFHSMRRKTTGAAIAATFAVCLAFGGLGHMFGGMLLVPVSMAMGSEVEELFILFITSLPWVVLAGSAFTGSELREMGSGREAMFVVFAFFFVVMFAGAASFLIANLIHYFDRWSGRTDDVEGYPRQPLPRLKPREVLAALKPPADPSPNPTPREISPPAGPSSGGNGSPAVTDPPPPGST